MRFKGLSEPLVGRVCSAAVLERHVGAGFLGQIRTDDPLVELIGVALSDDEKDLMVHVHAATETKKFVGTATVTVTWYEKQFETNEVLRGSPEDSRALDIIPCRFFEKSDKSSRSRPSVAELIADDPWKYSRNLASTWLRGKRPVRTTEKFLVVMLGSDDDEIRSLAQSGLALLVSALSERSISPSIKREIGSVVMAIARHHYRRGQDTDTDPGCTT